ncbi:hypothetical protein [Maridesulfovibrio bastinii]|jgi:hypothetical protein|uniref:hypothetical protein n=1 Tax=Maridesulfovibrio bastinii TaxID=47157 RepID=UPI0003FB877F|nr:hypothetical protein [Maridesulfovibrio bastinii]
MKIKDWLENTFNTIKKKINTVREVQPGNFLKMANEITELAEACTHICHPESEVLIQIERVKIEMAQLIELTSKPEFKRLSIQRRLELKESLIQSREQILNSIQTAPAPTRFLQ